MLTPCSCYDPSENPVILSNGRDGSALWQEDPGTFPYEKRMHSWWLAGSRPTCLASWKGLRGGCSMAWGPAGEVGREAPTMLPSFPPPGDMDSGTERRETVGHQS